MGDNLPLEKKVKRTGKVQNSQIESRFEEKENIINSMIVLQILKWPKYAKGI
jgi:hypothetical protein